MNLPAKLQKKYEIISIFSYLFFFPRPFIRFLLYLCGRKPKNMATVRLKNRYLELLGIIILVLALGRCVFPGIAGKEEVAAAVEVSDSDSTEVLSVVPSVPDTVAKTEVTVIQDVPPTHYVPDGGKYHRIISVPQYTSAFPDSNHVQLLAAQQWGVLPVKNRADAEQRMNELVYIGASPYYEVAHLDASIPYLVPRAAVLLQEIGVNFMDSLQVKGVPLHRFVVSSVLRTEEDVARLRTHNKNATEQSCHLYGTTFDINYNTFAVVCSPEGPQRENVNDLRLKQILSEVLNNLRRQNRCYIKYEFKQPCFHITVR